MTHGLACPFLRLADILSEVEGSGQHLNAAANWYFEFLTFEFRICPASGFRWGAGF
jgi:hypothetical protein